MPHTRIAAATAEIVGAFKAVWGDVGWGARMERILYCSIAALIEAQDTSLICLPRMLKDDAYRLEILERVRNPIVHGFFTEEYATWDDDYHPSLLSPITTGADGRSAALNENIRRHTYPRARVEGKIKRFFRNATRPRRRK